MDIRVNRFYYLSWSGSLESTFNGIYEVLAILTYNEAVEAKVDLKKSVYERCNIVAQFDVDLPLIRTSKILKIRNVESNVIEYLPDFHLVMIPDSGVKRYEDLALVVHLGIFENGDAVSTAKTEVSDLLRAKLGIEEDAFVYSVKSKWLRSGEYNTIVAARLANGIDSTNNFLKVLALEKEVADLKTRIAYYEQIIIDLNGQLVSQPQ